MITLPHCIAAYLAVLALFLVVWSRLCRVNSQIDRMSQAEAARRHAEREGGHHAE